MSIYNGMSGEESNLEQSYSFLSLAGQVALRVSPIPDIIIWRPTLSSFRLDSVRFETAAYCLIY